MSPNKFASCGLFTKVPTLCFVKASNSTSITFFHRSLSGPFIAASYVGLLLSSVGMSLEINPYLTGAIESQVDRCIGGSGEGRSAKTTSWMISWILSGLSCTDVMLDSLSSVIGLTSLVAYGTSIKSGEFQDSVDGIVAKMSRNIFSIIVVDGVDV